VYHKEFFDCKFCDRLRAEFTQWSDEKFLPEICLYHKENDRDRDRDPCKRRDQCPKHGDNSDDRGDKTDQKYSERLSCVKYRELRLFIEEHRKEKKYVAERADHFFARSDFHREKYKEIKLFPCWRLRRLFLRVRCYMRSACIISSWLSLWSHALHARC